MVEDWIQKCVAVFTRPGTCIRTVRNCTRSYDYCGICFRKHINVELRVDDIATTELFSLKKIPVTHS